MRLRTALILGVGTLPALVVAPSCSSNNSAGPSDAAVVDESDVCVVEEVEPVICTEFTEAGAPCPAASPVRCFSECEAGGCYCREQAPGEPPIWVCTVDTTCLPDCAPLDDGCSPVIFTGDDGPEGDGPADGPIFDSGGDADAGDASG